MTIFRMAAAAAALACSTPSLAATVIGGTTVVNPTANLSGLGLTLGLTGTATLGGSGVNFPITGGMLDPMTLAGQILHEGSGVRFSFGATNLDVGNFIIDTVNSQILGDVALNGSVLATDAQIFTFSLAGLTPAQITNLANPSIVLLISPTAAGALTQVFDAPNLTGEQFGLAATAPQLATTAPVPEPSTWAMLILGFGMIGAVLRRRIRALAPA
jgi:hypothetical protein